MRRSTTLDADGRRVLVSNDFGDYAILCAADHSDLLADRIFASHPKHVDLEARALLDSSPKEHWSDLEHAAYATRKAFALEGPSLHIFVVTLRCDHSCHYCQVSRAAVGATGFDMRQADADAAVDLVFQSPSNDLTIEFQGGEPALRFDLVRRIVERAEARNMDAGRRLTFAMVSTLHHLTEDDLIFCRDHSIRLSTSIDGPAEWHDAHRPNPTRDSWERTIAALGRARAILGDDGISALPTLTRRSMTDPRKLIDHYRDLGFPSIFLRPISPYGFALKTRKKVGYDTSDFLAFYVEALEYILALNAAGEQFEETYASILLRHMLTPFHSGYLDLRSPAGAGLGVLVYNYDGQVYPADEARMAAETGDDRFALGRVTDTFVPYCGADPVYHAAAQGDPIGNRETSDHCIRHTFMFSLLFNKLADADASTMTTFLAWALSKSRDEIVAPGHIDR
mgnify:FL=1